MEKCQHFVSPRYVFVALWKNHKNDHGLDCRCCGKQLVKPLHRYGTTWTIFLLLPLAVGIERAWFPGKGLPGMLAIFGVALAVYFFVLYAAILFSRPAMSRATIRRR